MEGNADIAGIVEDLGRRARAAAVELRRLDSETKNAALAAIADALAFARSAIEEANAGDVAAARAAGLAPALIDRLALTPQRFDAMVKGVRDVAALPDPVGATIWERERPGGIAIRKVREPFGVIAVVFESRPNVFADTASLCLKTSNAVILRGGREAKGSNAAIAQAVRAGLRAAGLPDDAVQSVPVQDHEAVRELVRAVKYVDVAIPRGGEWLIRAMCEAALVPVLKHYKGVCHIYVDDKADLPMALSILDNAKVQRPGACNAVECLLVHERLAPVFMPMVEAWANGEGVRLHRESENPDWTREYLALELNVKRVADVDAAIRHINEYSSHHSDAIVTNDTERAERFLRDVDSAAVYHNASTRFTDGGEFGFGAEIGISTDKLHARGPMGLEELCTYKYEIRGDGAIRQ